MKPLNRLISLLVLAGVAQTAVAGDTEKRLELLERRVQALSDMMTEIQGMQREVQQLRGEVETQNHAMDALTKRQRDLYLDLENRLKQLQAGGVAPADAAGAPGAYPPAGAASTPPAVAPLPAPAGGMAGMGMYGPASSATQPPPPPPAAMAPATAAPQEGMAGTGEEKAAYDEAFKQLMGHQYVESSRGFRDFLKRYPNSTYAGNAQYWLGEAAYAMKNYPQALQEFDKVMQSYGQSSKVPDALLKMGYIHYEQEQWDKARGALEKVVQQYPSSTTARLAAKKLDVMRREGH